MDPSTVESVARANDKFDQYLRDAPSRFGEIGKSLERSDDYLKQQMQYVDRLAVLSGAVLAFSVPAFTSLQNTNHTITHRITWLACLLISWIMLILAMAGSIVTHHLLIVFFAQCTSIREANIQSVLFGDMNLINKRIIRSVGGDADQLQDISPPNPSFQPKDWHKRLAYLLSLSYKFSVIACIAGIFSVLVFLVLSTF